MAFELGEWKATDGYDCPVDGHQVVEIERRDGSIDRGPARYWASAQRYQNSWYHNGGNCDIVRYRDVLFSAKPKAGETGK